MVVLVRWFCCLMDLVSRFLVFIRRDRCRFGVSFSCSSFRDFGGLTCDLDFGQPRFCHCCKLMCLPLGTAGLDGEEYHLSAGLEEKR